MHTALDRARPRRPLDLDGGPPLDLDGGPPLDLDDLDDRGRAAELAASVEALAPRPFQVVAARGDATDPSSHLVHVLLSEDLDLASLYPPDPDDFKVPGNVSNGGLMETEADIVGGSWRVVAPSRIPSRA